MHAVAALRLEALGGECELYAMGSAEPLETTADWIRRLHRQLTRFDPDSELSRLNALAGRWVEVSPELHELLDAALDAYVQSDGLVNAAVLPSLIAAGYDRTFREIAERADVPSGDRSQRTPLDPLPDLLQVKGRAALLAPGAAIDLGGLAKGWIADRAVERLGPNSLVSCAGDLHARGGGETGEGWPVGFGDRTLLLADRAAATSGTTGRRWGNGMHHLIDPRTGAPARSDLREVSVLARTALEAEVLAKTALLLGSERATAYLEPRAQGWVLS